GLPPGFFPPQRPYLGLDSHAYSRAVLRKLVEAGGQLKSFELAARMARCLAEGTISGRHLGELTQQIGAQLRQARARRPEAQAHPRRPAPVGPAPQAVAVGVDGGRLLTRVTTAGHGPGVHGHGWREDKVACLQVLEGPTFAADPHPQPPRCFLDAPDVAEVVRGFQAAHGGVPPAEEVVAAAGDPGAAPEAPGGARPSPAPAAPEAAAAPPAGGGPPDRPPSRLLPAGAGAAGTDLPGSSAPPAAGGAP